MEKINVAELLKDCPKGMELDCVMCNNPIELEGVVGDDAGYPIKAVGKDGFHHVFTSYGASYNHDDAKCVIFPKGKTTWEGFQRPFKDGDVITCTNSCCTFISIFKERMDENFFVRYCAFILGDNELKVNTAWSDFEKPRLATEEEKKKLFDAIKDNGYKWNEETKTLEKLITPKFKVGDKIKSKENRNYIYTITGIREKENKYECGVTFVLRFSEQDNWELVPNKFDITTLVPFESKVLVRESKTDAWEPAFYGFFHQRYKRFYTTSSTWVMCIPYNEDTKHLTGATNDCDEFYKTWEERA